MPFRRCLLRPLFPVAIAFFIACAAQALANDRPNIILVMTDDMGYGDLGVTGNPIIKVPTLDKLAGESVEVESFYVCPVCAPTRAGLMTGRYNYRTGVTDTWLGRAMMHSDETTIAEVLRDEGYHTGIFGKWHLGDCYPMRPQDQGFEEVLVHTGGGLCQPSGPPDNDYFDPSLMYNGERIKTKGYCSDVYVNYLIDFIQENKDEPFFAYLPFNCPHSPYIVADEYKQPYDDLNMKVEDFPMMGHIRKSVPENTSAVYGMVQNIDDNMARLLNTLEELELAENTIVIFMTDNGPNGARYDAGMMDFKGSVHEGGIRTCFFVRWPARLEAGRKVKQFGAHIDVMPTLLDACGIDAPEGVKLDGRSLLPLLQGKDVEWPGRTYYAQWHRGDVPVAFRKFAARNDDYKLVCAKETPENAPFDTIEFELYDMKNDPLEMNDLAAEKPEVVRAMADEYLQWLNDVGQDHGYEAPKIIVGTPHENPVVLTRQDWRGLEATWAPKGLGHWELAVAGGGTYDIRVQADAPANGGTAVLKIQGITLRKTLDSSADDYVFKGVTLKSSDDVLLQTWIEQPGEKPYGVRYVYVERVDE